MLTIKIRGLKQDEYIFNLEKDDATTKDLIKELALKLNLSTTDNEFKIIFCGKILNHDESINHLDNKTAVYVVKAIDSKSIPHATTTPFITNNNEEHDNEEDDDDDEEGSDDENEVEINPEILDQNGYFRVSIDPVRGTEDIQRIIRSLIPLNNPDLIERIVRAEEQLNEQLNNELNYIRTNRDDIRDEYNELKLYDDMSEGDKVNIDKICELGYDRLIVTKYYQLCENDIDKTIDLLLGSDID
jgi:hypothetical protein